MRLHRIGAVLLFTFAAVPLHAQEVPEQIVNAMNTLWGRHAGFRANHAKGLVVEGSFTPSADAAKLSKADIFSGPAVPVTVRFSDATGIPTIPDGSANANPHGMSIKYHTAGGGEVDMVTNSLKFFPVRTGEDFRDLLTAIAQSGPGSAKPTKVETFIATHPAVPAATATVGTPASFATETYNGVNAFVLVDAAGHRQPFRVRLDPAAGTHHLNAGEAARQAPDYLSKELTGRLAGDKVVFHLMAQLANPGDPTDDATKPWPADRKLADLGTITLTKVDPDSAATEKSLLYLPTNLEDGIEPSDDPLIQTRAAAYAVSFGRRTQ